MGWASRRAESVFARSLGPTPSDPVGWAAVPMELRADLTTRQILQGFGVDVFAAMDAHRAAMREAWASRGGNIAPTVDTTPLEDVAK